MTDIVTEAREAMEGITPGPWRHDVDSEYGETSHIVRPANAGEDGLAVGIFTGNYGGAGADADFIAAAPGLVSRLCVEVEAMRTRNDRQKRGLQQMDDALRKASKERADAEARSRATDASEFLRFLNALAHVAAERDAALAEVESLRDEHDCGQEAADNWQRAVDAEAERDAAVVRAEVAWTDTITERDEALAEVKRLVGALGDAWDDGNATGLDGWVGPGRGAEVDQEAIHIRDRFIRRALDGGDPL